MVFNNKRSLSSIDNGLRRRAEDQLRPKTSEADLPLKDDESLQLFHELQVQRIELEMQNAELVQTRNELESALDKYTDLYDFAPVGYLTLDRNGTISTVNFAGADILGVERSRAIGRHFKFFVEAKDRPTFTAHLDKGFTYRIKDACEVKLLNKRNIPLIVRLELLPAAIELECRIALIDISECKRMEELLRQSEKQFRTVVEDQTDIICRFLADGKLTFVNAAYCRFFGKKRDELLGINWNQDVFPDDVPIIEEQLRKLSPSNPIVTIENRVYSSSGKVCWMHFINSGVFDTKGRLVETQSIGRDITERKQAEEDLHNYAHHLIEMEENLRKSIAAELHDEIGSDLTALGIDMTLMRKSLANGNSTDMLARIVDSEKLINDVRRTARNIMESLRPMGLDDLDLNAALTHHSNDFSQRTGIAVLLEVDETFPRLTADKEIILFRIVQESLTNISKHAKAQSVKIALCEENRKIHLSVCDDGKGFTPLLKTGVNAGYGMGLKTMRERAEMIGGTFQLVSLPGSGTTVSVLDLVR